MLGLTFAQHVRRIRGSRGRSVHDSSFVRLRQLHHGDLRSDAKKKTEVVRPASVVGLVDPHLGVEEADDEGNRGNQTMPQARPESSRRGIGFLPLGVWTS